MYHRGPVQPEHSYPTPTYSTQSTTLPRALSNRYPQRASRRNTIPLPIVEHSLALHSIIAGGKWRLFPVNGIQQDLSAVVQHSFLPPPTLLFSIRFSERSGDLISLPFPVTSVNEIIVTPLVNDILLAVVNAIGNEPIRALAWDVESSLTWGAYVDSRPGKLRIDSAGRWLWTGFALSCEGVWELTII
ncbi:hypothetical protein BDQ12DRAFT_69983 [Crucibulum laeve]|uniref:Uncharacterized protein n=1 Tax=Crucibulum laeve TaxID=68775 RepID=A0A5C3M1P0_9AGAR|nr:hypothetical protein BDQ12DRAFT_69983 [Crucibulum laeve]